MKTALVTGANRGLGKGFAEVLAAKGYTVYAGVRNPNNSFDNAAIKPLQLDVQDDASIRQAAKTIESESKHLDLVVNNAGLNKDTATGGHKELVTELRHLDRAALVKMFDVNAMGPLMVTKYTAPLMTNPGGFIINISSERASFVNENYNGNYGYRGSKVALNMFTRCLLFDLPKNVSTFAVHPGWVISDMNPRGNLTPGEAAEKILRIIDNWQPEHNGAFLNNDGSLFPL